MDILKQSFERFPDRAGLICVFSVVEPCKAMTVKPNRTAKPRRIGKNRKQGD